MIADIHPIRIKGPAGQISVTIEGRPDAPAVLMTHSILSSSQMWDEQARLLAACGWRVVRADTRGHGQSDAASGPYTMQDLVSDSIAVLDALSIERAHYIGLSLGGMSGFGLGLDYAGRLLSLCLCDARADMPPALATPWDERIAIALQQGCAALAAATTERWFGQAFLSNRPDVKNQFNQIASATSVDGFVGCARAIQGLDYIGRVAEIAVPTTLIVGSNDGPLPLAMAQLHKQIKGSVLEIIPGAGHLPNIDQPQFFNAALMRHFFQNPTWSQHE